MAIRRSGPSGCLRIGRKGEHQLAPPVAVDVQVGRALVVAYRRGDVPLPGAFGVVRILKPPGLLARKVDDQQIGPAVAVDVVCEIAEAVAVVMRVVFFGLVRHHVHLPIGRRVVDAAGGDVHFAVVIEIADRDAFAAEFGVELGAFEADLRRRLFLGAAGNRNGRRQQRRAKNQGTNPTSHEITFQFVKTAGSKATPSLHRPCGGENQKNSRKLDGALGNPRLVGTSLRLRRQACAGRFILIPAKLRGQRTRPEASHLPLREQ